MTRLLLTSLGVVAAIGAAWNIWSTYGQAGMPSVAPQAMTAADARQQEILNANIGKPGDPALDAMYLDVSSSYFGGRLPPTPVRWEPRLAEVGALAARSFTLEGMFGHVGRQAVILLNPALQSNKGALERALCHEIVHAYLYSLGDSSPRHGPVFKGHLRRLADAGAFEGIVADEQERANLRAWLDAESARLEAEQASMEQLGREIEQERAELTRDQAALAARPDTTTAAEIEALNRRREAYNQRATQANARGERDREAAAALEREVQRYNLMLVYPDGIDDEPAKPGRL